MKKKSVIILLVVISLLLVGTIIFLLVPKYNLVDSLNYMKNLESYKVVINRLEYDSFDEKIVEDKQVENFISDKTEKNIAVNKINYFDNGKRIDSKDYKDGKAWYYHSNQVMSSEPDSYRKIYNNLFSILEKYNFIKKGNKFEFKNEKYIDDEGDEWEKIWDLEDDLEDVLKYLNKSFNSHQTGTEEYGLIDVEDVLGNVIVTLEEKNISSIKLVYVAECYTDDEELLDCSKIDEDGETYSLEISFSDYNNIKVEIPKEVKESLKETTAGNWVGVYKNNIICSDGKSYEERIELTDEYNWFADDFHSWDIKMKGYSCDYNSYSILNKEYNFDGNKLYVYDATGEVIVQFEYNDGKIIEYDENNNIKATFEKEK